MTMKTDRLLPILLMLACPVALGQAPDRDAIALLQSLKQQYPATRFTQVTRTPMAGVYEVVMGANVAYVGRDVRYFLFGHLVDMHTQQDLTAARLGRSDPDPEMLRRVDFAALPLSDAVRRIHGDGSRVLAVFSDPRCPYCTALDEALGRLGNVTVYTFLLPWLGPESREVARALWSEAVPERAHDATVLDRNLQLARQLGVRGTPMLIAADGRVSEGMRSDEALRAWLAPESRDGADPNVHKERP